MVGQIFDLGETLIDKLLQDEDAKQKARLKLARLQQTGELAGLRERMKAIRMEAKSEDAWTSRARPTFMYVVYAILLVNCVAMPAVAIWAPEHVGTYHEAVGTGFAAIPGEVWATFTAGYLGYASLRTYEKGKGLAGNSKAQSRS